MKIEIYDTTLRDGAQGAKRKRFLNGFWLICFLENQFSKKWQKEPILNLKKKE